MSLQSDNPAEIGQHCFERAGLGKAPFRLVGFFECKWQAAPDAPVQPGKSCDYCYQACETDDYEDTLAARIIRGISAKAVGCLPGYEDAPWEINRQASWAKV